MKLLIDYEKAKLVFGKLLTSYRRKEFPYNLKKAKPPQIAAKLPKNLVYGTREHANFLWCSCYYMRGGIQSDVAINRLARLYEDEPVLFAPHAFAGIFSEAQTSFLRDKLLEHGLGFGINQIPNFWRENFVKITNFWKDDPRKIFSGVESYEEACRRVMNGSKPKAESPYGFYGFREKMVSMVIYFFVDAGLMKPFQMPIPVDFHAMRVVLAHEIAVIEREPDEKVNSEKIRKGIIELFREYAIKEGVSPQELSDAIWLLSRSACRYNPGNKSHSGKYRARKTPVTPAAVSWEIPSQQRAFENYCALCPVNNTCKHNIPNANYYRQGIVVPRGPREEPPQYQLSFFSGKQNPT